MEWISVKDVFPDENKFLLVAVHHGKHNVYGIPFVAKLCNGVWYASNGTDIERFYKVRVTHWMQLPDYKNIKFDCD